MTLDPTVLSILVCPQDRGPLLHLPDEHTLYNPRLRCRYPIDGGILVLLVEEAIAVDDAEHERLMALADASGSSTSGTEP